MKISYNRPRKLLIDKKMSKADLKIIVGIAPNTMIKLRRDQEVTLSILWRICKALDANIDDIIDFLPEESHDDLSGSDYVENNN